MAADVASSSLWILAADLFVAHWIRMAARMVDLFAAHLILVADLFAAIAAVDNIALVGEGILLTRPDGALAGCGSSDAIARALPMQLPSTASASSSYIHSAAKCECDAAAGVPSWRKAFA